MAEASRRGGGGHRPGRPARAVRPRRAEHGQPPHAQGVPAHPGGGCPRHRRRGHPAGQGAAGRGGDRRGAPRAGDHPEALRHGLLPVARPAIRPGARHGPARGRRGGGQAVDRDGRRGRRGRRRGAAHDRCAHAHGAVRAAPGPQLLTGLRGKDVVISFVESYGRVAVEDPEFAPQVGALLEAGNTRLHAAGFAARSAFLTSPTAGGGSWLAHSTLLSGLWIDNQQRYRTLLASDRLTLNRAFHRASWRTVDVEPGVSRAWPEGAFYGSDRLYTAQNLSYRGPLFNFASIPDQYTMAAFQRAERATPGHQPVMAEIVLLSSHTPWAPLPRMVDWDELGDGTVFAGQHDTAESETTVWRDRTRIRTAYRQSIEYSLDALISYVTKYGDDNLVLVFLGDHQPAPFIAGEGASRDVPITVVARDRAVLDRISGWGWQDGLKPGPQAPVWRMNAFRDRFLTAFGPQGGPGASPSPSPR